MNGLISKLRSELEKNGTLSFAQFMEMALYEPEYGYYEQTRQLGRSGDFFTSVSVGTLFGELLAFQFAEWFDERDSQNAERRKSNLQIVEAGAHDGKLAADILGWFKTNCPKIFSNLEYCILEPSESRRDWQRKTLEEFLDKISWGAGWSDFSHLHSATAATRFSIVFSNELFDAMPVHRLGWNAVEKRWFEWGVDWNGESFVWKPLPQVQPAIPLPEIVPELQQILPNEFTTEICVAATRWWTDAAKNLECGKIVAIDYGLLAEEFFVPERSRGTLRAFAHHQAGSDLLARPGEQDITAHVNFSTLQSAGEMAGLQTEAFISQSKFLTRIAERTWAKQNLFNKWDASRCKQFQTLTHPEHLGRPFRVLVQSR